MSTPRKAPLSLREGQNLEFKRAAVLKDPFDIAREVVAMLNASGGKIWIGVSEHAGVAVQLEDIPDVEKVRQQLRDYLIEVIEPNADGAEPQIVLGPQGEHLLLIEAKPDRGSQPYAALRKGLRYFGMRVGDRVRPLSREEIVKVPADADDTLSALKERRNRILALGKSVFWIGVQPDTSAARDVTKFKQLLHDPKASSNRRSGWTYFSRYEEARTNSSALVLGNDTGKRVAIHEDGGLEFQVPLADMDHAVSPSKTIYPLALLEYSVSFFRMASEVLKVDTSSAKVNIDVLLVGTTDWKLPAFPPGKYGDFLEHEKPRQLRDVVLDRPLSVKSSQMIENPDEIGFVVVKKIYQWFNLPEERIPSQYDRVTKRLTLTD